MLLTSSVNEQCMSESITYLSHSAMIQKYILCTSIVSSDCMYASFLSCNNKSTTKHSQRCVKLYNTVTITSAILCISFVYALLIMITCICTYRNNNTSNITIVINICSMYPFNGHYDGIIMHQCITSIIKPKQQYKHSRYAIYHTPS